QAYTARIVICLTVHIAESTRRPPPCRALPIEGDSRETDNPRYYPGYGRNGDGGSGLRVFSSHAGRADHWRGQWGPNQASDPAQDPSPRREPCLAGATNGVGPRGGHTHYHTRY